jgi:PST family polysaccharide transporter
VIDVVAYTALTVVTLGCLAAGLGAAALAWGFVAQALVLTLLGVALAPPWRDRGGSVRAVLRVVRYSVILWLGAALSFLGANIDNLLVALLAGASALGVYALCYSVGNTITIGLAQVLNRVALPYYGRDRYDPDAAPRTIRSVFLVAVAVAAIPAFMIAAVSPEIADFLFGSAEAAPVLALLAAYGVARAGAISVGTALNGIGEAGLTVQGSAANVVLMVVLIPPLLTIAGPAGVAAAVLGAVLVSLVFVTLRAGQRLAIAGETIRLSIAIVTCVAIVAVLSAASLPLGVRIAVAAMPCVVIGLGTLRFVGASSTPAIDRTPG